MDTVIQNQMDTVIHSLRQRFRQTRSSSRSSSRLQHDDDGLEAFTPDLMPPVSTSHSQAPTPLPTTSTGLWRRGSSVKSRNSLKSFKRKIFGGTAKNRTDEGTLDKMIPTVPSEENIVWTAPSSPQIGALNAANIPRRRNSARLRELQRLLRAYHEQRSGWTSTPSSPQAQRRPFPMAEPPPPVFYRDQNSSNSSNLPELFSDQTRHTFDMPVAKLSYCRNELGPERPLVLESPPSDSDQSLLGPNVLRRMNLSELELALLNGANPSCPSSLLTTSSSSISPPQPFATAPNSPPSLAVQYHDFTVAQTTIKQQQPLPRISDQSTTIIEDSQAYQYSQELQHQVVSSSKELRYHGGTTVVSTTHFPPTTPLQQVAFSEKDQTQPSVVHLPLISPSPYEQIHSYMPPPAFMPTSSVKISNQIMLDQIFRSNFIEIPMEKSKQKKKKRRNKVEEVPKMLVMSDQFSEVRTRNTNNADPQAVASNGSSPKLNRTIQTQNAKQSSKGGSTNILSMGIHQLIQRHRQPDQKKMELQSVEPLLKSAKSEPRLAAKASRREHWLLMSRPELPGSTFLSPTPSFAAAEHLDRLRERITETKYVTAVFESRGGLGPVLNDVQAELEHWLGDSSSLLAIACEVHWSVPERFRSRQLEIELKQCLHAVLRINNRRILSLNDGNEEAEEVAVSPTQSPIGLRRPRHRSYSTHSLNRPLGRPFPIALARSKTEESCIRDAELDAFQGIYRRYYPALLPLQDPATVKAHQDYWTLESLTDVQKAPLVPDPARFLYQPEQPAQLVRKSLVAVNMAVLRMVADERDYDAEEARGTGGHAKPGLKESDL
ncbi:CA [Globodera pallida]|nr:CA [Globodera pallida]